jgi:hypothetical protein
VHLPDSYDILMTGNGSLIESDSFTSDFRWMWARFTSDGARLKELLLIGGRHFSIDGRAILDSKQHLGYVVGRRVEGKLVLETDANDSVLVSLEDEGVLEGHVHSVS